MKYTYKLVFDNGKIFHIRAKTRAKAVEQYCKEYEASEEWAKAHCRIVNLGIVNKRGNCKG